MIVVDVVKATADLENVPWAVLGVKSPVAPVVHQTMCGYLCHCLVVQLAYETALEVVKKEGEGETEKYQHSS